MNGTQRVLCVSAVLFSLFLLSSAYDVKEEDTTSEFDSLQNLIMEGGADDDHLHSDYPDFIPESLRVGWFIIPLCILLTVYMVICMATVADAYLSPVLVYLSDAFGLSDIVAGVTILAFGNAAPDIILGLVSAGGDDDDLAIYIGEVMGSSIINVALIPAILIFTTCKEIAKRNNAIDARKTSSLEGGQHEEDDAEADGKIPTLPIPLLGADALRDCLCLICGVSVILGVALPGQFAGVVIAALFSLYALYLVVFIVTNRNKTPTNDATPVTVLPEDAPAKTDSPLTAGLLSEPNSSSLLHPRASLAAPHSGSLLAPSSSTARKSFQHNAKMHLHSASIISVEDELADELHNATTPAAGSPPSASARKSVAFAARVSNNESYRRSVLGADIDHLEQFGGAVPPRMVANPEAVQRRGGEDALSFFDKVELVALYPFKLLWILTMPTIEEEDEELEDEDEDNNNNNKQQQPAILPSTTAAAGRPSSGGLVTVQEDFDNVYPVLLIRVLTVLAPTINMIFVWWSALDAMEGNVVFYMGGVGAVLSLLFLHLLLLNNNSQATRIQHWNLVKQIMMGFTFVVSLCWLKVFSSLIIESIKLVATITGAKASVLSVTLLSAGASAPDVFAALAVARIGRSMMALSAAFAAPVMNMLLGVGVSLLATVGSSNKADPDAEGNLPALLAKLDLPILSGAVGIYCTAVYIIYATSRAPVAIPEELVSYDADGKTKPTGVNKSKGLVLQDGYALVGIFSLTMLGACVGLFVYGRQ